jgi:SAM-dependent methyltransferase
MTSQPPIPTSTGWGSVAHGRARWNAWFERMTRPVNDWLCTKTNLAPGMTVLDVACGTGQPALTAARIVGPKGRVIGIDIAQEMVDAATALAREEGLAQAEFRRMDAHDLDFPDATFDAAVSRWGVMFPEDTSKALASLYRVLKPGARYTCAFWDDQAKNPRQSFLDSVIRKALGEPPRETTGGGVAYKFADPQPLIEALKAAGFQVGEVETVTWNYDFDSVDDFWQGLLEAWPSGRMSTLSEEQRTRVKQLFDSEAERFRDGGVIRLPSSNHCLWAEKP